MIFVLSFFNPINLLIIINLAVLIFYKVFSFEFLYTLTPLLFMSPVYTVYIYRFARKYTLDEVKQSIKLDSNVWRIFGYIVIIIGILELAYFGIPLLGHVKYVHFGFTILHHIAVSSWILVFVNLKYSWVEKFKISYALIFPLLIFNRDIFLLTLCCIIFVKLINNQIKLWHLFLTSSLFIVLFSFVGKLRSGNVQEIIDLPTKFDLESVNLITFWLFTYATSPMFNVHYSYGSGERIRYDPLLTVFPEFYKLVELLSFPGLYLYLIIGMLLTLLPAAMRFPGWLCFSFFFYYQFLMGCVFSNKLGNTHTIYIFLIFFTITVFRQVFGNRKLR